MENYTKPTLESPIVDDNAPSTSTNSSENVVKIDGNSFKEIQAVKILRSTNLHTLLTENTNVNSILNENLLKPEIATEIDNIETGVCNVRKQEQKMYKIEKEHEKIYIDMQRARNIKEKQHKNFAGVSSTPQRRRCTCRDSHLGWCISHHILPTNPQFSPYYKSY